ncbi:nuclear transport factor 2 family protein, partial [Gordonia sputi]|uniref:nuclear transport factor 2 family protein n=1 Tax=Gordonia sputi TaxID=36823 RepID=UPI0036B9E13F
MRYSDLRKSNYPRSGHQSSFTTRNQHESPRLVGYMRGSVGPGVITEHRVDHPEIVVDGDSATGRWYLQDRVIVPEFSFMMIGAAFYADTYRRTDDGWRICATGYDRTYEATIDLKDIPSFSVTVGQAITLAASS